MRSRPGPHARSRRRPRAAAVVAVAVALVLVAELGVRWLEPALPAPRSWPSTAVATKVEQLEREAAGGCTDVVFVGNSMSRDAFVPDVFEAADPAPRSSYNAALDAASPSLLLRWVRDQVLPATRPATVVIGLASFDLNAAAATPRAALRSYDAAPFTSDGFAGRLEGAFARWLALVRNREALRDPETVLGAFVDRVRGRRAERPTADGIDGVMAADGHGLSRRDLRFSGDDATIDRLQRQFLHPFEIGGGQVDALRELVDLIEEAGATPVVQLLPVTDEYVAAHPDGAQDVQEFRRAVTTALDGTGAVLIPPPPTPEGAFADTHHLNGRGADAYSRGLPGRLRAHGVDVEGCERPGRP